MITQAYICITFVSNGLYDGKNVLNNGHSKTKFWSEWGMLVVRASICISIRLLLVPSVLGLFRTWNIDEVVILACNFPHFLGL